MLKTNNTMPTRTGYKATATTAKDKNAGTAVTAPFNKRDRAAPHREAEVERSYGTPAALQPHNGTQGLPKKQRHGSPTTTTAAAAKNTTTPPQRVPLSSHTLLPRGSATKRKVHQAALVVDTASAKTEVSPAQTSRPRFQMPKTPPMSPMAIEPSSPVYRMEVCETEPASSNRHRHHHRHRTNCYQQQPCTQAQTHEECIHSRIQACTCSPPQTQALCMHIHVAAHINLQPFHNTSTNTPTHQHISTSAC